MTGDMAGGDRPTCWLSRGKVAVLCAAAVASFHAAYLWAPLGFLVCVSLGAVFYLAWVKTTRVAFYLGTALGLAMYGPQLAFFWNVFGPAAIGLWLVVAIWLGFFLLICRSCVGLLRPTVAILCIPIIWTALDYFRGELNPLKFSWLTPGIVLSSSSNLLPVGFLGVYGLGLAVMTLAAVVKLLPGRLAWAAGAGMLIAMGVLSNFSVGPARGADPAAGPFIVGIQMEAPSVAEAIAGLDRAVGKFPQADVLILPEYTFAGPVPMDVRAWSRTNRRHLIAGGVEYGPNGPADFQSTVFVVDGDGRVVFGQAKCVPVQFFRDGRPAEGQDVWQSPWGPIGLCVCYDMSYARVTDVLVRKGARALITPIMDKAYWGGQEHQLHGRLGPARAAEYGLPVVRVCSSGVSQIVSARGAVLASAPFPGPGEMIAGELPMSATPSLPADRVLAPACTVATALLLVVLTVSVFRRWRSARRLRRGGM